MDSKDNLHESESLIDSYGYGIIYKLPMEDNRLSIEAKAIYAYICSYAGNKDTAYPSIKLITSQLNISERRFYKYRKELVDAGYLDIIKNRKGNRRDNNIYKINKNVKSEYCQFVSIQNESIQNVSIQNESIQIDSTNNNNINNNISKNNINKNNNYNNSSSCNSSSNLKQDINEVLNYYNDLVPTFPELKEHDEKTIIRLVKEYSKGWVIDAMTESIRQNICKLAYIVGILKNWKTTGKDEFNMSNERNSKGYTAGSSEETLRLEQIARDKGLTKDGEIQDIECDF